ncbi:YbaB/EbfC family nucleoid-associated protein, partial [Hydrocarboniphaga effusa]
MKGPLGQLMRQAQQVQDNIKRAQDEVAKLEATGESGAGMVRVTLDGKHQARKVE